MWCGCPPCCDSKARFFPSTHTKSFPVAKVMGCTAVDAEEKGWCLVGAKPKLPSTLPDICGGKKIHPCCTQRMGDVFPQTASLLTNRVFRRAKMIGPIWQNLGAGGAGGERLKVLKWLMILAFSKLPHFQGRLDFSFKALYWKWHADRPWGGRRGDCLPPTKQSLCRI